MYNVDRTISKKKILFRVAVVLIVLLGVIAFIIWYLMFRQDDFKSANFDKTDGTVSVLAPKTTKFETNKFNIVLPDGWELEEDDNPKNTVTYFSFHSTVENYDNRWLKVYVDNIPIDYRLNKLLPIVVDENKIQPSYISDECSAFEGAPSSPAIRSTSQVWEASFQGIKFVCNMDSNQNEIGTASVSEGYGVTIKGNKGSHKYFFVYIDRNVRPDPNILVEALKTFEAL